MDRKTMTLEFMARQLAAAFQIAEACAFAENNGTWELRKSDQSLFSPDRRDSIHTMGGLAIDIIVEENSTYYALISDGPGGTLLCTDIILDSNGCLISPEPSSCEHSGVMAEALFHLGLLTGEIESYLKVSVSAHQKMEWSLKKGENARPSS